MLLTTDLVCSIVFAILEVTIRRWHKLSYSHVCAKLYLHSSHQRTVEATRRRPFPVRRPRLAARHRHAARGRGVSRRTHESIPALVPAASRVGRAISPQRPTRTVRF